MVRTKVFVGNLAFSTKEPELAAAFGAAGKVIGANIITRGPRSLGYGFVEMESEEDAKKAVDVMNKKELNGRQINVEVAKPQEEIKEKEPRPQGENGAPPRGRGGRGRGGRRQGYQRRSPGAEGEGQKAEEKAEEGEKGDEDEGSRRRPRRRNRGRVGQKRVAEESKEESKTTLFVANLPFGLDDDGFAKVVGELGLKPKSAHVVKKRNGRSKGYGFVEFENEADQKKALDGLNKKVVDSRELSVKVALTEQPKEEEEEKPAQPAEKKAAPAEKKAVPAEKKATPAEKKTASPAPAEKKTASPAPAEKKVPEKKVASPAATEKKVASPASPAEKKSIPAEKKAESPAKTTEKK